MKTSAAVSRAAAVQRVLGAALQTDRSLERSGSLFPAQHPSPLRSPHCQNRPNRALSQQQKWPAGARDGNERRGRRMAAPKALGRMRPKRIATSYRIRSSSRRSKFPGFLWHILMGSINHFLTASAPISYSFVPCRSKLSHLVRYHGEDY